MAMIQFTCPGCSKLYRAEDAFVGQKTRCKQCGHFMVVSAGLPGFPTTNPQGPYGPALAPASAQPSAVARPEVGHRSDAPPPVPPSVTPEAEYRPPAPGSADTLSTRREPPATPDEGPVVFATRVENLPP